MNRSRLALIALAALLIGGCGTFKSIKNANVTSDFDTSARAYAKLVRWHELDSAVATFVSPTHQNDYRKRIATARNAQVVDYRIVALDCDPDKGEGTVKVEFDYYRLPSTRVLTVVDEQKWTYEDVGGTRTWRLQTPLPEFK
jgi:hypothetical protein